MKRIIWQAPGSSRIFDSPLKPGEFEKGYISLRTIWVLRFFRENGLVSMKKVSKIERDLLTYLSENFSDFHLNKSTTSHSFKPLIFLGFITDVVIDSEPFLVLSIEGRKFLSSLEKHDYNEAKNIFIRSTLTTSYPNFSTINCNDLSLFPFRILYFLLLKEGKMSKSEVENDLVYINYIEDVLNYDAFKKQYKVNSETDGRRVKFNMWIIKTLVSLNILKSDSDGSISLDKDLEVFLNGESNISVDDLFFEKGDEDELTYKRRDIDQHKKNRSKSLALKSYKNANFMCEINKEHYSFKSENEQMYLESHHVVPFCMSNFLQKDLDFEGNLIAICPNCHKAFHHGNSKIKFELIKQAFELRKKSLVGLEISFNDLLSIYLQNTYRTINSK